MLSSLFPFFFSLNFSLDIFIVLFSTVLSLSSAMSDLLLHPSNEFLILDMVFFISRIYISKYTYTYIYRCHSGKECACQCRRHKRCGFNPWVGKSPGVGNGNPFQYSCLENSMDREPGVLPSLMSHEHTHTHTDTHICTYFSFRSLLKLFLL